MTEYESFVPGVEVSGEAVRAFTAAFSSELRTIGINILAKHGIVDPRLGTYHPLQSFLDAMKDISDNFGSQMLFRIGSEIARNATLPPGLDALENCLMAIDAAYHMNHRGGVIGSYELAKITGTGVMNTTSMTCENPYPCAFDWGVIEGFAERFRPPGCIDIVVRHDDSKPCRRKGAQSCTYVISWV